MVQERRALKITNFPMNIEFTCFSLWLTHSLWAKERGRGLNSFKVWMVFFFLVASGALSSVCNKFPVTWFNFTAVYQKISKFLISQSNYDIGYNKILITINVVRFSLLIFNGLLITDQWPVTSVLLWHHIMWIQWSISLNNYDAS